MPKDKFIEVNLQLVLADPVVGADQPLLQISDGPIGKWYCRLCSFAQFRPKRLGTGDMFKTSIDTRYWGLLKQPDNQKPASSGRIVDKLFAAVEETLSSERR